MDDPDLRKFGAALVVVCGDDPGRITHDVDFVAITPDDRAAWCVGGARASLVDLATLEVVARCDAVPGDVVAVFAGGVSPDEVVVATARGEVRSLGGARLGVVGASVGAASFSRDGRVLASAPPKGVARREVTVCAVRPFARLHTFPGDVPIAVDAAGGMVAHAVINWRGLGIAFVRSSDGVTVRRSLRTPMGALALADHGDEAFVADAEGVARVPMDPARPITPTHEAVRAEAVRATRHGAVAVAARASGQGRGWAFVRDDGARVEIAVRSPRAWAATADGRAGLLVDGAAGACLRGDFADGCVRAGSGGHDEITDVAWSSDGARLASVATDGTIQVWDTATGEAVARIEGLVPGRGLAVAWSPEGRALQAIEGDGAWSAWTLADGMAQWRVPTPARGLFSAPRLACSPDGEYAAVQDSGSLWVFRRDDGASRLTRHGVWDAAWMRGDAATLAVTLRAASEDGESWELLDVRGERVAARGKFSATARRLGEDGRELWAQSMRDVRLGELDVTRLGPAGAEATWRVKVASFDAMLIAPAGRLLCKRRRTGEETVLVDRDGRVTALRFSLSPSDRMKPSPAGDRLAVVRGGRIVILALPASA